MIPAGRGAPLARLVRRLDLERSGRDRFRGHPGSGDGRVFGGMLVAQGLVAAGRTVERGVPHALHAQFLRAGRHGFPIDWRVTRTRDGFAFGTRQVAGEQNDQTVIVLTVGFTRQTEGLVHQDPMPEAPAAETLEDWEDARLKLPGETGQRRPDGAVEIRDCDPASAAPGHGGPARRAMWLRPRGTLPADPLLHAAVLVFASDRGLLSTAARPHGFRWAAGTGASLDHSVWLHRPIHFDDWVLYTSASPVAAAGRGLVFGGIWARNGTRLASVAQEGVLRLPRRD